MKEMQNKLDEVYNYILNNFKEEQCIYILNKIDDIQNKIDELITE